MIKNITDCIKAIDNHIANHPLDITALPEIRAFLALHEQTYQTSCKVYQEDITILKDKLSRRNMQIKDLKAKLETQLEETSLRSNHKYITIDRSMLTDGGYKWDIIVNGKIETNTASKQTVLDEIARLA